MVSIVGQGGALPFQPESMIALLCGLRECIYFRPAGLFSNSQYTQEICCGVGHGSNAPHLNWANLDVPVSNLCFSCKVSILQPLLIMCLNQRTWQWKLITLVWTREQDLVWGWCWRFPWEKYVSALCRCASSSPRWHPVDSLTMEGVCFSLLSLSKQRYYKWTGWLGILSHSIGCCSLCLVQFRFMKKGRTSFLALILPPYSL